MSENLPKCTDCGCDRMTKIIIVDRTYGYIHQLEYTLSDSKASFWTGHRPIAGSVSAYRCDACGLLKLYGIPIGL